MEYRVEEESGYREKSQAERVGTVGVSRVIEREREGGS